MAKQKTHKTLSKRIKISKSGKIMTKAIRTGHLKAKWSTNKKFRKQGYMEQATEGYIKNIKKLLPGAKIK
jgi:ribosomal protein L35